MIVNKNDAPELDIEDIEAFFQHLLRRVDWTRDLHFQTRTTIDTLDYTGDGFNQGSKVVIAASGPAKRSLFHELPSDFLLAKECHSPRWCMPGVLAIAGPSLVTKTSSDVSTNADRTGTIEELIRAFDYQASGSDGVQNESSFWNRTPIIVIVDDSEFTSKSLNNFLWVTFTRSNPANDIFGVLAFTENKHWGCRGPIVIDARRKLHHAPPLVEAPTVTAKIDALATRGGAIAKYL
jgi:4-hydroxy-3-polyprenylbenzoate decarboxylase